VGVRAPALAGILPPGAVGAEVQEAEGETAEIAAALSEEELAAIANASEGRRREFSGGRACARSALGMLGLEPASLPVGSYGAPAWPAGIVGSITHKGSYRAAAVARADSLHGIGLDAEVDAELPPGVLGRLACPEEIEGIEALIARHPGHAWDRLLFSAKEAAVKAAEPLGLGSPGLATTKVRLDARERSFGASARFGEAHNVSVVGAWEWRLGLILVAAWMSP